MQGEAVSSPASPLLKRSVEEQLEREVASMGADGRSPLKVCLPSPTHFPPAPPPPPLPPSSRLSLLHFMREMQAIGRRRKDPNVIDRAMQTSRHYRTGETPPPAPPSPGTLGAFDSTSSATAFTVPAAAPPSRPGNSGYHPLSMALMSPPVPAGGTASPAGGYGLGSTLASPTKPTGQQTPPSAHRAGLAGTGTTATASAPTGPGGAPQVAQVGPLATPPGTASSGVRSPIRGPFGLRDIEKIVAIGYVGPRFSMSTPWWSKILSVP